MVKYFLMHKDDICGVLSFDEIDGHIISYRDNGTGLSPYMGNSDLAKIKKWWGMRAVPSSRKTIQDIIRRNGYSNSEIYLAKNLALSMTDSYWVCPADLDLTYDKVKLYNSDWDLSYNNGKVPYHNATSYDPNASLGGQMEKYWDLNEKIPCLVKESSKFYGQQSVNEVIATKIHMLQNTDIPFVKYSAEAIDAHGIISRCNAFTSEHVEFISAYEIVESQKPQNSQALYDHYIDTCVKYGIKREDIQCFMDYQTLTDFIISNTDEHLLNFGVLRDANTMELLGPAPIFDSGNSMFYNEERTKPYTRVELLTRPITSFYKTEDKMLAKVKDKTIVRLDLLPTPDEIKQMYMEAGIPETKASFISQNYSKKIDMVYDFQHGKTISLYHEKKQEALEKSKHPNVSINSKEPKIIVLCGIPGIGKSKYVDSLVKNIKSEHGSVLDSTKLYSVDDYLADSTLIFNKKNVLNKCHAFSEYANSTVVVSLNAIRKEVAEQKLEIHDNSIYFIAEMRIKNALLSGANVIFDAANLNKESRENLVLLAKSANTKNIELHVLDNKNFIPEVKNISSDRMKALNEEFKSNYPTINEGWINIVQVSPEITLSNNNPNHDDDSR